MTDIEVPMPCAVVHTKYQPTEEEWKCPKCGVGSSLFYIEDPADKTDDCDLLHNDDGLYCHGCDYGISGKTFDAKIQKQRNLVSCLHCKGTGLVPGDPK